MATREMITRLGNHIVKVYASFKIFAGIRGALAPNVVGQKQAEINARIQNRHNNFFSPVELACKHDFLLGLAKLFDNDSCALSLKSLNTILGKEDKKELRPLWRKCQKTISKLSTFRNGVLAHNDIEIPNIEITVEEIEQLFTLVENHFDKITLTERTTWAFSSLNEQIENEVNIVLEILGRSLRAT